MCVRFVHSLFICLAKLGFFLFLRLTARLPNCAMAYSASRLRWFVLFYYSLANMNQCLAWQLFLDAT